MENVVTLHDLPQDIYFHIFSFLDPHFLLTQVLIVCKSWKEIIMSNALWNSFKVLSIPQNRGINFINMLINRCQNIHHLRIQRKENPFEQQLGSPIEFPVPSLPHLQIITFVNADYNWEKVFQNLIQNSPCIRSVDFKGNILKRDMLETISKINNLKALRLAGYEYIDSSYIIRILINSPHLEDLSFEYVYSLDDHVISSIFRILSGSLTSLILKGSDYLSDDGMLEIHKCSNLSVLELKCGSLSDKSLHHLKRLTVLTSLTLYKATEFTSAALKDFFIEAQLSSLNHFLIEAGFGFDDSILQVLASKCLEIESLHIEFCGNVTDEGIYHIMKKCSKLSVLNLRGSCVDGQFLQELHKYLPLLTFLSLRSCHVQKDSILKFVQLHPQYKTKEFVEKRCMGTVFDENNMKPPKIISCKFTPVVIFTSYSPIEHLILTHENYNHNSSLSFN